MTYDVRHVRRGIMRTWTCCDGRDGDFGEEGERRGWRGDARAGARCLRARMTMVVGLQCCGVAVLWGCCAVGVLCCGVAML